MPRNKDDELFDRTSAGGSAYDQQYFTDDELRSAAAVRAAAEAGQTDWGSAHDYVEGIRGKYGYSGGDDGNKYVRTDGNSGSGGSSSGSYSKVTTGAQYQPLEIEPFSYENAPQYVSKYQDKINALATEILGQRPFSYDPETDPLYSQYRKQYTREGQRAAADTLGQAAAMTGGMPSTAAIAASQQAGDYYAAQMADKIPELQQLAYGMYLQDQQTQRQNLEMLQALENGDYGRYTDLLGQWNKDRSFAWDQWGTNYQNAYNERAYADALAQQTLENERYDTEWAAKEQQRDLENQRYDTEWAAKEAQRELENQRYDTEWQFKVDQQDLENQRYDTEWQAAQDQQALENQWHEDEWNWKVGQQEWENNYALQQLAYTMSRGSGSGGGGGGSSYGGGDYSGSDDSGYNSVFDQMYEAGIMDAESAVDFLHGVKGYTADERKAAADYYVNTYLAQQDGGGMNITNLQENGAYYIPGMATGPSGGWVKEDQVQLLLQNGVLVAHQNKDGSVTINKPEFYSEQASLPSFTPQATKSAGFDKVWGDVMSSFNGGSSKNAIAQKLQSYIRTGSITENEAEMILTMLGG
ncbi:MAG: hypothetical protein MJ074_08445 [Oscillospiraceae bacterium]|nr:hypothetical protein [Oscillospiraceae bacterium]